MRTNNLTLQEGLREASSLPFCLIRSLSEQTFGPTPHELDPEEWIEARFFDKSREIRFFLGGETMHCVEVTAEETDRTLEETYLIQSPALGRSFTVCHVLDTDEDGQSYIRTTRLTDWKGENIHG